MNIQQLTPNRYNYNSQNNQSKNQNIAFEGFAAKPKFITNLEDSIANKTIKIIQKDGFKKIVDYINKIQKEEGSKINKGKFAENLFAHLTVFGSTLLNGFYVIKTIKNKDLEEDKRKTLAINQGLVWAVSTVCAYTLDNLSGNFVTALTKQFEKLNAGKYTEKQMSLLKKGISCAKSMIVIDMVYRFLAPVLVTPLANHIGNKLRENKAAKLALTNEQNLNKMG